MNYPFLRQQLQDNAGRIALLVHGVDEAQARWQPDEASWSILEVVNHLLDEERADFRVRLDLILHQPEAAWPPIDPTGWVTERSYNTRALQPRLQQFLNEREQSLTWLDGLGTVDWQVQHVSSFGTMRAGDMFAAWVAHDQLHMRQLIELQRAYLERQAQPFDVSYAGEW